MDIIQPETTETKPLCCTMLTMLTSLQEVLKPLHVQFLPKQVVLATAFHVLFIINITWLVILMGVIFYGRPWWIRPRFIERFSFPFILWYLVPNPFRAWFLVKRKEPYPKKAAWYDFWSEALETDPDLRKRDPRVKEAHQAFKRFTAHIIILLTGFRMEMLKKEKLETQRRNFFNANK